MAFRPLPCAALLALAGAAACNRTVKETYDIDITGAPDAFAGATKVTLYASGTEVASSMINGNAPFSLAWRDVDPLERKKAVFSIRATDANNALVAYGASPEVELIPASTSIRIFVQRPGSLVRAVDFKNPLASHVAVAGETLTGQGLNLMMSAPVFGAGVEKVGMADAFSNEMYVYNPITHLPQTLGRVGTTPRANAAALARSDGKVIMFGGVGRDAASAAETGARLDAFAVGRREVNSFEMAIVDQGITGPPETARSHSVLVQVARPVYAFGGLDIAGNPLDTVVNIDPAGRPDRPIDLATRAVGMTREPTKMMAPRVGHTATAVSTPAMMATATTPAVAAQTLVLVFGGAPMGGVVADLFNPADQTFLPLVLDAAGGGRKLHAAVNVTVTGPPPEMTSRAQVLLLGGQADSGAPRGDSVLYDPVTRTFAAGPLNLKTPRHSFAAFVIGNDLVVAGGIGPDMKPLATAEVYDAKTFALVTEMKAEARAGATVTLLPNLTVMLLGGTTEAGFSAAIEIYQPRSS